MRFEKEEDAKRFGESLRLRMGKFGLKVSEEKSKMLSLRIISPKTPNKSQIV